MKIAKGKKKRGGRERGKMDHQFVACRISLNGCQVKPWRPAFITLKERQHRTGP